MWLLAWISCGSMRGKWWFLSQLAAVENVQKLNLITISELRQHLLTLGCVMSSVRRHRKPLPSCLLPDPVKPAQAAAARHWRWAALRLGRPLSHNYKHRLRRIFSKGWFLAAVCLRCRHQYHRLQIKHRPRWLMKSKYANLTFLRLTKLINWTGCMGAFDESSREES